ncbi:unnamed protein product [Closterium sp. NIES-54]
MVTTTTPRGQRVSICTCTRTGCHLATFTRRPGSSLYTPSTEPPRVAASKGSTPLLVSPPVALDSPLAPQTWSLPPLPPSPTSPCLPCIEGRQHATPNSSSFPLTTAPLQTLHMDVWGPARVTGQGRERYFLLSVSSSTSGSARTFLSCVCTLTEVRRIGWVIEVARTSMIHAVAPHFLWPFAVLYAAHQLNLWPRVSLPETSPTLRWTGEVGDASVFRVWGSRAFVRDTSVDKLCARAIPCVVTFDESVPFYRLLPHRSAPPFPRQSSLLQVDPLPGTMPVEVVVGSGAARGAASWGMEPGGAECEGAGSGGAEPAGAEPAGAEPKGAESEGDGSGGAEAGGAEPWGAEPAGVEPGGAEPEGVEPGAAESEGAESGGAEPRDTASSGGPEGALLRLSPRSEPLSPQQLREWFAQRTRLRSGAARGGDSAASDTGPGGARTRGKGAAGTGSVGGAGAGGAGVGDPAGAGGTGAGAGGAVL